MPIDLFKTNRETILQNMFETYQKLLSKIANIG